MFKFNLGTIMRARAFWVISILLLCTWTGSVPTLQDEQVVSSVATNQQLSWSQTNQPIWQSGWSPQLWQPQPTGMLWEVDFSPDGTMIAAVDISTKLLTVWNSTDGRVISMRQTPRLWWMSFGWTIATYSLQIVVRVGIVSRLLTEVNCGR